MPEYLFYKVDEKGDATEALGKREAPNAETALSMVMGHPDNAAALHDFEFECAIVSDTLSGKEVREGRV